MRLINADDVKELLLGLDSLPWEEQVDELVDAIPTAFDLEKTTGQLEEMFGVDPMYYGSEARWGN
jgi:hypothetical protein